MAGSIDDKHSLEEIETDSPQPDSHRRRWIRTLAVAIGGLVVLAVALGVGLGVGLRHPSQNRAVATSVNGTNSTSADGGRVLAQPSSNFVLKGQAAMAKEPPTTRHYDFLLEERTGSPDGFDKPMLVVNGMYPGPTIEVNNDDRVVVNVTNAMSNASAVHWHGLFQRGTPWFDGTNSVSQCGIPPGHSFLYNFTLDTFVGTTWWHSHYSTQYTDGLSGAFIVYNRTESLPSTPSVDGELSIQLSDLYHRFSTDLLTQYLSTNGMTGAGYSGTTQGNEPVPDAGTINGVGQWGNSTSSYTDFTLEPNSTYRLRIGNHGSFAASRFSVDNHTLTVVEADGVLVEPYEVSGLVVQVAQRYSVILRTNETAGAYWMRHEVQQDAFTYTEPGFQGSQLGVIRYGVDNSTMPSSALISSDPGSGSSLPDLDSTALVPYVPESPPNATFSTYMTVSMQNTGNNQWLSFVNSTSWAPLQGKATLLSGYGFNAVGTSQADSQLIVTVPDPSSGTQVVDVYVQNYDDGDHPFHLHGYKPWMLGQGQGRYQGQELDTKNPMRRDTFILPAYSWTILRFVADNPGMWFFHCHLTWHMASGLAMQFLVLPNATTSLLASAPSVLQEQCKIMRTLGQTVVG
ncbi:hypothetical protein NBRC10512_005153 [Rhodotorula toruloides]|uniref:Multicopper oxidase n=1 Tax=Rhodotorula toruloides (strain NP11) TaxID=1130832 RepID=M7WS80_RHOT1|nr:multicopper oxidase [Rhodotorula toruloides NP11]EMS23427.1 multicopper oxidase [Rhodotorula toruloides NP11]